MFECLPYPFHQKGEPAFMVSYSLCFVLNLCVMRLFSPSVQPVSFRKAPHTTLNVPNKGTHYSKKWCKVTAFLLNNIFHRPSFLSPKAK